MHSKQVRRRRAVVAALVVVSLILLTAYFGGSSSNPLHTVQRGVVTIFSPIQKGASIALSPFRDIASFFSDTFKAKSQVGHRGHLDLAVVGQVVSYVGDLADRDSRRVEILERP